LPPQVLFLASSPVHLLAQRGEVMLASPRRRRIAEIPRQAPGRVATSDIRGLRRAGRK
jgi:hypothetical protein